MYNKPMKTLTKILILVIIIATALSLFYYVKSRSASKHREVSQEQTVQVFDGRNTAFIIDGKEVQLVNGLSEVSVTTSSASKITTRYFGNEAQGDLNGDGLEDVAFLITQNTGGSGIFFYAVVALKTTDGYKTTNAFLIGDRIAPQSTEIKSDSRELHVNYAERKPGEPMTAQPSVGAVTLLKVTNAGVLEGLMK
jgi:hypothetical protein